MLTEKIYNKTYKKQAPMKQTLLHLISFLLIIILTACENSHIDEPQRPGSNNEDSNIEYYIKYELNTTSKSAFSSVEATFLTEKGYITRNIPREWEGTFGPFNKLETANFYVKINKSIWTTFNGRISICRGNQPYILKAEKSSFNKSLNMSYSITEDDLK